VGAARAAQRCRWPSPRRGAAPARAGRPRAPAVAAPTPSSPRAAHRPAARGRRRRLWPAPSATARAAA
jgi:hypothetical protein